jgi:hypothetical protein
MQVGKNNADIYGGAAAKRIYVKSDANFVFDSWPTSGPSAATSPRRSWNECRAPVSTDPESGC